MQKVIKLLETERKAIEERLPFDKMMDAENRGTESFRAARKISIREDEKLLRELNAAILILKTSVGKLSAAINNNPG